MKLPSPSMFVSLAALVIALGGTSYAAAQINGSNIKAKSITSSKIAKNSLGSGVIKDGKIKAEDLAPGVAGKTRWALIGANGQIALQSGGFTVVAGYPVLPATATDATGMRANGNVYINAGEDLAGNGISATLTLQNTSDTDGGGMAGRTAIDPTRNGGTFTNPEFSGEVTVSRCNPGPAAVAPAPQVGPTNCAPTDAQNVNSLVVSPRNSDGSVTVDGSRKSFYVFVTSN